MKNIRELARKIRDGARGGMVDAADLKAIDSPLKTTPLSYFSRFVHGRVSALCTRSQTKTTCECHQEYQGHSASPMWVCEVCGLTEEKE